MMHGKHNTGCWRLGTIVALLGAWAIVAPAQAAIAETQLRFGTPEAAVEVLLTAFKNSDDGTLAALFGPEYADRLLSKDKVAAKRAERSCTKPPRKSGPSGRTRRTGRSS